MNELWQRLQAGGSQLFGALPALLAAAAILIAGYLLARLLERWADALLKRIHFDRMAEAGGLSEAMGRTGTRLDPIHAVGKLLFWLVMLVVILLASTALGLESINTMFGTMLSYIPTLIAAIVIVILGMIVGEFVRALVLASAGGVGGVPVLAKVAKATVVVIAVFMAIQQLGIAEEIVTAAFTLILGAIALAAGLAFGLGGKELAAEVLRRWYQEGRVRRQGGAGAGAAGGAAPEPAGAGAGAAGGAAPEPAEAGAGAAGEPAADPTAGRARRESGDRGPRSQAELPLGAAEDARDGGR